MKEVLGKISDKEISKLTWQKVEAAKKYIQNKYSQAILEQKKKQQEWKKIIEKMNSLNLTNGQISNIKQQIFAKEAELHRKKRKIQSIQDYFLLSIIGRGSFGQVRLARDKQTNELVAIKRLKKQQMILRNQISHVNIEKELLSMTDTRYLIQFKCSFQDAAYLYIVMQFLPGGDFMSLLIQKDTFTQQQIKFYICQLILAVESVHKLGFIHRDIKPDNILLDRNGHIKLTDFGLSKYCRQMKPKKQNYINNQLVLTNLSKIVKQNQIKGYKRKKLYSKVGTPQYIAPEVLNNEGYDQLIDSWSIGIILYQSLFGYTPFSSDDPKIACKKIMNWKYFFEIPDNELSQQALNLLTSLICEKQKRLNIKKMKSHPFFKDINWKCIHLELPPCIPVLTGEQDTSKFEIFQEKDLWYPNINGKHKDFNFTTFNFKKIESQSIGKIAQQKLQKIKKQRLSVKLNSSLMKQNKSMQKLYSCYNNLNQSKIQKLHLSIRNQNKKNTHLKVNSKKQSKQNKENISTSKLSNEFYLKQFKRLKTINS